MAEQEPISRQVPGGPGAGRMSETPIGEPGVSASEQTERLSDQARQKAAQKTREVKDRAKSYASDQKDRASTAVGDVGSALREAARKLHENHDDRLGDYAEMAADRCDRLSGTLRDRDVSSLLGQVEDFARRRPEIFLGAAFVGGLAASRFLRSSSEHARPREPEQVYPGLSEQEQGYPISPEE